MMREIPTVESEKFALKIQIKNRLTMHGYTSKQANELMQRFAKSIDDWLAEYLGTVNEGTHSSAENIADMIWQYDRDFNILS